MKTPLCIAALLFSMTASAVPRIAVVQSDDLSPYVDPVPAFLEALDEPALVVNLHGRQADADAAIIKLREQSPAVVFALGAKAAYAVKNGLPDTPIVFTSVLEPRRYGIEGGQTTGIHMTVEPEIYLSQFVGFFPEVSSIGVLRGPSTSDEQMGRIYAAAKAVGVEVVVKSVDSPRKVRAAFHEITPEVDALWLRPDREILTRESFRALTDETHRRRIPLLVDTDNMVRAGGLFAVMPSYEGLGRQAAAMSKRIADGTAPSLIEVEEPNEVLVVLNLRAVRNAEIAFEELLLDFVDLVIE